METIAAISDMPVAVHPDRPRLRKRPLKALHHFRELLKDKEDTEQVFWIFEALARKSFRDEAVRFGTSEQGRAIHASEPYLPTILDDHDRLRAMPEGSVAHAYCDFMEAEGLTAAGLVAEGEKMGKPRYNDLIQWYGNRNRDTHDLLHVLTGYGRDSLGEQCVLAFTYGQDPSFAHLFIAYAGGFNLKKETGTRAPIFRAIGEAKRHGKAGPRVWEMNITELLAEPLDAARERLNIGVPRAYHEAHRILREEGRDPYDLLAKSGPSDGMESAQPA
ncbi:Coq4 family protein [Parasphingopyxis lamellibrachiae]|nr:Coq4 family protein [Parasphingopyxis lamellibrachiae]